MKRWVPGLMLGLSVFAGSASAQTVSLRLSHWLPTAHPMHIALPEWTQSLNKASEGAINVTILSRRSCALTGSAITSRSRRSNMRGPPSAPRITNYP